MTNGGPEQPKAFEAAKGELKLSDQLSQKLEQEAANDAEAQEHVAAIKKNLDTVKKTLKESEAIALDIGGLSDKDVDNAVQAMAERLNETGEAQSAEAIRNNLSVFLLTELKPIIEAADDADSVAGIKKVLDRMKAERDKRLAQPDKEALAKVGEEKADKAKEDAEKEARLKRAERVTKMMGDLGKSAFGKADRRNLGEE